MRAPGRSRMAKLFLWGALLISALSWAQGAPNEASPESEAKHLVVMIDTILGAKARFGAGIVVGVDREHELVYIVTANHLVRGYGDDDVYREAEHIEVRFNRPSGLPYLGQLLPPSDGGLDLAVLVVHGSAIPNFAALAARFPFDRVAAAVDLSRGDMVRRLGHDRGVAWYSPVISGVIAALGDTRVTFETNIIAGGASGGGLFTEDWNLVGMVTSDLPPNGEAVRLDVILATLATWDFPVNLGRQAEPSDDDREGEAGLERPALYLNDLSQSVEHMHIGLDRTLFWFTRLSNDILVEIALGGEEEAMCQEMAAVVSEIRESVILVRREQVRSRDLVAASEQLLTEILAGDAEIEAATSAEEQDELLSQINGRFSDMATDTQESLRHSRSARELLLERPHAPECYERVSGDLLNLEGFLTLLGRDHESLADRLRELHMSLRELVVEPDRDLVGDATPEEVDAPLRLVVRGEPTDDPRVRQALLHSVAWDTLPVVVAEVAFGESLADLTAARPAHDPELALQLMAEAGYPDGVPLELRLADHATAPVVQAVEVLAAEWSAIATTSMIRGHAGTSAESTVSVDVLPHR